MNAPTVVILAIVIAVACLALRYIVKSKKAGGCIGCDCGCGCSDCHGGGDSEQKDCCH